MPSENPIPKARTQLYLIWRACERWGLRPWEWESIEPDRRTLLLSYEIVRYGEP